MPFPFDAHVALVDTFLARRAAIVERLESRLLNVKGKAASRRRDRAYFDTTIESCFFGVPGLTQDRAALRGQLAAAHLADGFEPMYRDSDAHQLDPAALIVRAYERWDEDRWPGASARLAYAHTLYSVFVLRLLEDLSLQIWDVPGPEAGARLDAIQRLLDRLNAAHPAGALVRDARWLLQTAQGPLTKQLAPYFRVAESIADTFANARGLAMHEAGAKLAGGHLRSQLHHRASELHRPPDDPDVLATTRNSNAMDLALLVWDLVPLLEAYRTACAAGDREARARLACAILQGCAADPELLLVRLDLLTPCTMIETLFVHVDDGERASYTTTGARHLLTLARYADLIDEAAAALAEDARAFGPSTRAYSALGIVYGFCADLLSNMALGPAGTATARTASRSKTCSPAAARARTPWHGGELAAAAAQRRRRTGRTRRGMGAGGLRPHRSRARSPCVAQGDANASGTRARHC